MRKQNRTGRQVEKKHKTVYLILYSTRVKRINTPIKQWLLYWTFKKSGLILIHTTCYIGLKIKTTSIAIRNIIKI
jgi:hypothetical protein